MDNHNDDDDSEKNSDNNEVSVYTGIIIILVIQVTAVCRLTVCVSPLICPQRDKMTGCEYEPVLCVWEEGFTLKPYCTQGVTETGQRQDTHSL